MTVSTELEKFFSTVAPVATGDRLIVAFSGGPDSTALLWQLHLLAPRLGVGLHAVHIDHGLDRGSRRRAVEAHRLCSRLGVAATVVRGRVARQARPGESLEVAARRIRYAALERERQKLDARYIATGHNADDQIETILLRLIYGSGLAGLAGIRSRRGHIVRPLLSRQRRELHRLVQGAGLQPVNDPTNLDLGVPRNRVRHVIRPRLEADSGALGPRLLALAAAAKNAAASVNRRLERELVFERTSEGPALHRGALSALPAELWPFALSLLHQQAGIAYPPPRSARRDLRRQIESNDRVGCDCGGGWRWESHGELLKLCRPTPSPPAFAYTLEVPGECEIRELSLRFRLRRGATASWMFRHSSRRAGLNLPLRPGDRVVIRSRRAGDRVQPLGCPYSRRLKDLLIDRGVPRRKRGRLPLLEVGSRLAWVPGVTIDNSFRLVDGDLAWIAETEPL